MPATPEEEQLESRASAGTALLTLICGLVLMGVSYHGWRSEHVEVVDHLVKFGSSIETSFGDVEIPTLTTARIMQSLLEMSVLVVIAAAIGIVGSLLRHKGPVCVYVILASGLSLVVLVSAAQTTQRRFLAAPLLMSQVEDVCNATTYIRLTSGLGCDFAANFDESEITPCGETCQFRVRRLREHNGCVVLPTLCSRFSYEPLHGGGCLAAAASSGLAAYRHTGPPMSEGECQSACDEDIGCDTVIDLLRESTGERQCIVLSARASYHDPRNWTDIGDSVRQFLERPAPEAAQPADRGAEVPAPTWSHKCLQRKQPQVLLDFMDTGLHLAMATAALGVLLLLSVFCTCCILYNVNMSRQGLPTAYELALLMLCPCASRHVHRKFNEDLFESEVEDSDGEDSDDDSVE